MLFEGHLEQQEALTLLDSGASANFISKKALDIGKLTLNPTEATPELPWWYCCSSFKYLIAFWDEASWNQ